VAVGKRHPEVPLERARPPRKGRLREGERLARAGGNAPPGGGGGNPQLLPNPKCPPGIFPSLPPGEGLVTQRRNRGDDVCSSILLRRRDHSAAARRSSCAARKRSASSAAMQPRPAAVTAWR